MKNRDRRPIPAAVGALALAGTLGLGGCGLIGQPQTTGAELSEWFTVSSPVFRDGRDLPTRYACTTYSGGAGVTPPLRWSGTPSGTRSFAIVMDDPEEWTKRVGEGMRSRALQDQTLFQTEVLKRDFQQKLDELINRDAEAASKAQQSILQQTQM